MSTRIHGGDHHHAEQAAHDAHTGDEHASQALTGQAHTSRMTMQRTKLRAKIQHNKAQVAAFYRNKRFATSHHKPPSASAQKLVRQLGQRPRPGQSAKGRGKDGVARDPREDRHAREDNQKRDEKHEHSRDQHGHEHEHQRRDQDQNQGQGRGQGQSRQQQQQQQPQQQQQQQQQGPSQRDGQPRERREKPPKFALKVGRIPAVPALPTGLRSIAERHGAAPDLPHVLATAYTKAVVGLTSQMELGPLLAPLLVLNMSSRMTLKRDPERLNAQRTIAHRAEAGGAGAAGAPAKAAAACIIGQSLDMTLARQRFAIEYSDDEQSLAMVKQYLLDATRNTSASSANSSSDASRNSQEVRVAPPGSGTGT
ncbi:helicase [Paraburkholderia sp. 2C]